MVGTALHRLIFHCSISCMASAGSNRPAGITRVSPTMTARSRVCTPPMWNIGPVCRLVSPLSSGT